jgi:DNA mismatch endonuclease (patch repair protein)
MSLVKGRGNLSTELRLIRLMRVGGVTGWRRNVQLPGHPDFVFRKERVAVFVDGDFWHGNPKRLRIPKSNVSFWQAKIARNRRRDRLMNEELRNRNWVVLRIWESSLTKQPTVCLRRLRRVLQRGKLELRSAEEPGTAQI